MDEINCFETKRDSSKGGYVAQREPRVQSIRREKKSHLGEKSPKIRFFGNVRERERERERGGGGGGGGRGRKESFGDFSGFVGRKSLSLELKFFVMMRATRRHQKEEISPNIQKMRFGENQSLQVRKSFEVS